MDGSISRIPREFNLEKCIDEIKEFKGLIFPPDSMVRSITYENRENKEKLLLHIQIQCNKAIEWFISESPINDDEDIIEEVERRCDWKVVRNYDVVLLNLPVFEEFEDQEATVPVGSVTRKKSTSGLVPTEAPFHIDGTVDLNPMLEKLGKGLNGYKDSFTKDSLFVFVNQALISISGHMSSMRASSRSSHAARDAFNRNISHLVIGIIGGLGVTLAQTYGIEGLDGDFVPFGDSNIVLSDENDNKTFIDMKHGGLARFEVKGANKMPLVPRKLAKQGDMPDSDCMTVCRVLRQVCRLYLMIKVGICLVSDYKTNQILQLAFEDEEWGPVSIPIRSRAIDHRDSGLTTQMALVALIWDTINKTKEDRDKELEILGKLHEMLGKGEKDQCESTDDNESAFLTERFNDTSVSDDVHVSHCIGTEGMEFLQVSIDSVAVVLGFEASTFNQYFPTITLKPGARKVVLKMFDYHHFDNILEYNYQYSDVTYEDLADMSFSSLEEEIKCYIRIRNYNNLAGEGERIRVPVLHNYGKLRLIDDTDDEDMLNGHFIVLDYIGEEVEKLTEPQYQDAKAQLERMGRIGIRYNDVAPRNLRVKDGRIAFIDFGNCECTNQAVSNQESIDALKEYI